jgi:hypothetical protein
MKTWWILLGVLIGFGAYSQTTNGPPNIAQATNAAPARPTESLQAQTLGKDQLALPLSQLRPNETARGRIIYSGIAVEVAKKGHPLQLLNPLAPPAYGSSEDNTVRDPISGRAAGLKLFSIKF